MTLERIGGFGIGFFCRKHGPGWVLLRRLLKVILGSLMENTVEQTGGFTVWTVLIGVG